MPTNEILTLQFGHYSNFIGTHWWNIQEGGFQYDPSTPSEINHDVLFREGLTLKGEVTFTPRLLLVDLKGSLKTLSEEGELYKLPQEEEELDADVLVTEEKEEEIPFQKDLKQFGQPKKIYDLDSQVRVWSDFLYTRYHPRTVNIVKQYQHSSENTSFDIYPLGTALWKTEQFSEDFSDKIRIYIEECDNFQGFQIILDAIDGFSGLSNSCIEYLSDEYSTKSILGFPVNINDTKNPLHLLNLGLCYANLAENSSLFIPLSTESRNFNHITYKSQLPYHTSAILAAALDTFTLNYRLKRSQHSMIDLCSDLSNNGRKGAAASLTLPFPLKTNEDLIDCLNNWQGPLVTSITPNCQLDHDDSLHLYVIRGIPERRLKRPLDVATRQRDFPAYRCESIREMLGYYLVCTSCGSRNQVAVCGEQLKVRTPFPRFFDSSVGTSGDIGSNLAGNCEVEGVGALAGVHSGKFVGGIFDCLSKDLEKIKYKRFHQYDCEGFESDQFKECFDKILDLRDCYEDNYLI